MGVFRKSIGAILFGAFVVMSLIIAMQGYWGYRILDAVGDLAIGTYDGPLMAVNYARAANLDFSQIERKLLQRAAAPSGSRGAIDGDIDALEASFDADLAVAQERSGEADEQRQIETIKSLVAQWSTARRAQDAPAMEALARGIDQAFDLLIEYNTDHGFVGRRKAADAVERFRYVLAGGMIGAILVACAITLFATRRIARPLSQAAAVADRIAGGEFETPIPKGGEDETGTLLRSMTVMQDSIRAMMARECARAQSAEVRLTDALETSDEGVLLVGADGRVVIVNSQLKGFFPQAAGLRPGASFADLLVQYEASFPNRPGPNAVVTAHGMAGEQRLPDGRWVRITVCPTSDGGRIIFVSDFTEIKEREQSYKQAKKEAEAASAAKSRFLANMSHELRTPLNAIIGFSEILSRQLFGALGHRRYVEYSSDILHSGRHLLDVINSVLDLSKSEAGRMQIHAEPLDLADVLRDCARMVAEQCERAELNLVVAGLDVALPVAGEAPKLRQLFLNLLSNAVKFTAAGGTVAIEAVDEGGTIAVCVADSGIGMSPQDIQVALTPFAQVDNRLERKYEGTGLGLPLAKSFVELHDGTLDIDSAVGAGTRITVRLARRGTVAVAAA